jgi:hypothetical protein
MLKVNFKWVNTAPSYPNLGCLNVKGFYRASVFVKGINVVLGEATSGLITRIYKADWDSNIFWYNGEAFSRDQLQDIKRQIKNKITQDAISLVLKNLKQLVGSSQKEYQIIDHSKDDAFDNNFMGEGIGEDIVNI